MPLINQSPIGKTADEETGVWFEKSLRRADTSDPDFQPIPQHERGSPEKITVRLPKEFNFKNNRTFVVYESQLDQLLKRCLKCGGPIMEKNELKGDGSQYRLRMECLEGCKTIWCSQPVLSSATGNYKF